MVKARSMPQENLKEDERTCWLALHRTPALDIGRLCWLMDLYGSPAGILSSGYNALVQHGLEARALEYLVHPDWKAIEKDLEWLNQPGNHLLTYVDKAYPPLLKKISSAPIVLFIRGEPAVLQALQLSMVGSRNPTPPGRQTAHVFAGQLSKLGIVITSGMALGIDYCSHLGAMEAGGRTVAVLGNGPDVIYPKRHKALAERIIEQGGALVSEFSPATPPLAENFPRRNRIISGLAAGVLVIEAAQYSGSLITARHAMEQGREVFAVPGSILNPLTRGCHHLIKQGAKLVESLEDILEELGTLAQAITEMSNNTPQSADTADTLDEDYRLLLDAVAYEPVSVDRLIEYTGLTADAVSSMLLILEIRGYVATLPGGFYMRINQRSIE
jgi:DNA processing protein